MSTYQCNKSDLVSRGYRLYAEYGLFKGAENSLSFFTEEDKEKVYRLCFNPDSDKPWQIWTKTREEK